MFKRLLLTLIGLGLGAFSCSQAYAQVDKLLINALSWVLQKQIEEMEKANDPNRGLSQYDARDRYDSRDTFAPRAQPVYQDVSDYRDNNRAVDPIRQAAEPEVAPAAQ